MKRHTLHTVESHLAEWLFHNASGQLSKYDGTEQASTPVMVRVAFKLCYIHRGYIEVKKLDAVCGMMTPAVVVNHLY